MRMDLTAMDEWLAERCGMYTEWLDEGRIAYSSRVLPIGKSLPGTQRTSVVAAEDDELTHRRIFSIRFPSGW